MKIAVKVDLFLGTENYRVELSVPATTPDKDAPFEFLVRQYETADTELENADEVLRVALGDKDHVYVAAKPPQKLIVAAGVADHVKSLQVLVEQGEWDDKAKKFV